MTVEEPDAPRPSYRTRIAILPGDPPVAYRPGRLLVNEETRNEMARFPGLRDDDEVVFEDVFDRTRVEAGLTDEPPPLGEWFRASGAFDSPAEVRRLAAEGLEAQLDVVYFANGCDCCGCPPHPALAAEIAADGWNASPWSAHPWRAHPWRAHSWSANPWSAHAEELNVVATGRPPTSSVMPAPLPTIPPRPATGPNGVRIGVLDSGLAGGFDNADKYRPTLFGMDPASMTRISGWPDLPSQSMGGRTADNYLDPVAGHGTFIAGIIEQLTPGCTITVQSVFEPEGDVGTFELAFWLWVTMTVTQPQIVNFSFGGTGRNRLFERLIDYYHRHHDVVFVAAAGNEGSCVEQYPAALPSVIGVAGLGPSGPAHWSNYGPWVDACAPGTDLVSSFFARFDGDLPRINSIDSDAFEQWATWTGTSFAAPVVVAALAREMATTGCTAAEAVERIVHAPHLARLPNMGTIVNL